MKEINYPQEYNDLYLKVTKIVQGGAISQEQKEQAVLSLLSLDISKLKEESQTLAKDLIKNAIIKLDVAIDDKDQNHSYKFLEALLTTNDTIMEDLVKSKALKNSDFMAELIDRLIKSKKEHLALEFINQEGMPEGTEEDAIKRINYMKIKQAIEWDIRGIDFHLRSTSSHINENIFKKLLDVYLDKAPATDRGTIYKLAIENADKSQRNKDMVIDMALHGYQLNQNAIYSYASDNESQERTAQLGKEIFDNKIFFSRGKLTSNDAKRVGILSSALATGYFPDLAEQKKYISTHKGVSPLKLAIDTNQFDLAIEMIKKGEVLKINELSIGMRFKNAIGMLNQGDIKKFSETTLLGKEKHKTVMPRNKEGREGLL